MISAWIWPATDSGDEAKKKFLLSLSAETVGAVFENAAPPSLYFARMAFAISSEPSETAGTMMKYLIP